jgi:hypothetical protein
MKRFCFLLGVLWLCAGCTSVGDKAQWEEAMKDLRGENMQMGSKFSTMSGMSDRSLRKQLED